MVPWYPFPRSTSPLPPALISSLWLLSCPFLWGTNNSKGANLLFFKLLKPQSAATVPGQAVGYSRIRSSASRNFLWFCFALFMCVQEQRKQRVGVERGEEFVQREQKRESSWKQDLNQSNLALLYVSCELFSVCFWAPLRLLRCNNRKKWEPKLHPQWMNIKWVLQLQACMTYTWWCGLLLYSYTSHFPHSRMFFRKNIVVEIASWKCHIFMLITSKPCFFKMQKMPLFSEICSLKMAK